MAKRYAVAHGFAWSSADGIEVFFCGNRPVLLVPRIHQQRLLHKVYLYTVPADCFEELEQVPPAGHNFRALEGVVPLSVQAFESVAQAVKGLGGVVCISDH